LGLAAFGIFPNAKLSESVNLGIMKYPNAGKARKRWRTLSVGDRNFRGSSQKEKEAAKEVSFSK
jgi:hypothetical protein